MSLIEPGRQDDDPTDETIDPVEAALQLAALGWSVLPAKPQKKKPALQSWTRWQEERPDEAQLIRWFEPYRKAGAFPNFYVACGTISSLVVCDLDNRQGEAWWADLLGVDVLQGSCGWNTGNGIQIAFRLPDGHDRAVQGWSHHSKEEDGPRFDIRGDGGGVIVPPSIHENGRRYRWLLDRGPSALAVAPELLLGGPEAVAARLGAPDAGQDGDRSLRERLGGLVGGAWSGSKLHELLGDPPGDDHGRNVHLTKVAGHLANLYPSSQFDAYLANLLAVNGSWQVPMEPERVDTVARSIWKREQAKKAVETAKPPGMSEEQLEELADHDQPTMETGWLTRVGDCLMAPTKDGLGLWGDFDISCLGVVREPDNTTSYRMRIKTVTKRTFEETVTAELFGDPVRLSRWLSGHECTVFPIDAGNRRLPRSGERLRLLLQSQGAPESRAVELLGWDGEGLRGKEQRWVVE